ncbi:Serine/threonine-protein phosphatase 1 [Botrimarina hoheduenensis]|uniref:Serine/threonine-protein phosphatase 1 n=2 Tax=Botrimarina hoheduenensis TaxID=2528000 RepID=A0A5C5VSB7_9BACT|nr:Serine/threonine-protein phosphatase 1 [Botrimarina hoheduenensis]
MHGCLEALEALLQAIAPQPDDLVVTLGDYIDRGPDSCGVVERLRLLASQCQLVPLLGNHEEMMLSTLDGRAPRGWWLSHGGEATQKSYDRQAEGPRLLQEHREWLATCREYHETDSWFFTHANYVASEPLISQPAEALRWQSLAEHFPGRHMSGKRAVVGHTAQRSGEVLWTQQLVCIDTHCYAGGWLTGLEVTSGRLWQVSRGGRLRERQAAVPPPGER